MKCLFIQALVFMLLSTQALALDFLGPPTGGQKKYKSGIGFEYVHGETDIDAEGVLGLSDTTIKDIEMNKIYFTSSTALTDDCELFMRFGGANADVDKDSNVNNLGYLFGESDNNFSIGGGARFTMHKSDSIQWGLIAQLSYVDITDFDRFNGTILGVPVSLSNEAEVLEAQFAIGPTVKLSDTTSIYGGAMFHFLDGEAKLTENLTTLSVTSDLEQDSVFGGYIGMGLQIAENSNLNIEYQATGDYHAFGIGMVFRFGHTSPDMPETKRTANEIKKDTPTQRTVQKKEFPLSEPIDPNKTLLGYRVYTDDYGQRTITPVYEEDEK